MNKYSLIIFMIICFCSLKASPPDEQYRKILSETSVTANAASLPSDIRQQADSLKGLQASVKNIIATESTVLALCSALYDNALYHDIINYVSYCRPLLESIMPDDKQAQSIYVDILNHCGMAYGEVNLGDLSIRIFEKALRMAYDTDNADKKAVLYNNIGSIYLSKAMYEKADTLFIKAARINEASKARKRLFINYNNLSVSAAERSQYNKALEYAFLAMHQLDTKKDMDKRMLLQRNIAEIYLKNEEPSLALRNLREVIEYQEKNEKTKYLADSYSTMAHIFQNDKDSFSIYMHKAENAAQESNSIMEKPSILLELGRYYSKKNEYKTACRYFEDYAAIKDSILDMEMQAHIKGLSGVYEKEIIQAYQIESLENTASAAKLHARITIFISIFLITALLIAAIILQRRKQKRYYLKARQKLKEKLDIISNLENEKHKYIDLLEEKEEHLNINEKKRTVLALQALRTHEFTESLTEKLKQLLLRLNIRDISTNKALREVLFDLNRMENDSSLKEFVNSFENINTNFYKTLSEHYPTLTARELRMCALLKLGMSSKEIADITFREVRSVEAVRNRLRKKLALEQSDNLAEFLKQF